MRKYSILIVDDEINVTRLLEKVFLKEGYITYIAGSGNDALNVIECHAVDVVITDIKMPGISGIELLKKIKDIDPSIKIIMITAFATIDTAIETLKLGACDYITKPFNLDEILLAVQKVQETINESDNSNFVENDEEGLFKNYLTSKSLSMIKVIDLIKQVSDTRTTVIIYGETGTGKELAAHMLHSLSSRSSEPFVKVNCGAIPDNLLESELFGYERGAFTGAVGKKPGRFELADGGTIFLDEIGDISPVMQVKLLRVLQEREFERLGGTKTIKVNIRIIAATNKNLENLVAKNSFRQDLYYRLNVIPICIPPLRERREDIPFLADDFLQKSAYISSRKKKILSEEAMEYLVSYNWPGNIRELENVIERCVVITNDDIIEAKDLPTNMREPCIDANYLGDTLKLDTALDSIEREIIIKTLRESGGNKTRASEILGISRRSLHRKIIKYNIEE